MIKYTYVIVLIFDSNNYLWYNINIYYITLRYTFSIPNNLDLNDQTSNIYLVYEN